MRERPRHRAIARWRASGIRLGVILTLTLAASRAHAAADSVSVADCVRLARAHAPALLASLHDARAAAADSIATGFNRRPEVSLLAGATVAPTWSYDPAITNLGEYHLQGGVQWPLADGGERARDRLRAGITASHAREQARLDARDAGERAAEVAYELLRIDDAERVTTAERDAYRRLFTLVRSGIHAGVRSPADSMRLSLADADAALDLGDLAIERRADTAELLELIGRAPGDSLVLMPTPPEFDAAPSVDDSLGLFAAIDRSPELGLARSDEALARLDSVAALHRNSPNVTLALDAGLAGTDLTHAVPDAIRVDDPDATFADRLSRDLGASAGIDLKWPLFDRARGPALMAKREALRAAIARHDAERARQRREAGNQLERWRAAAARVGATRALAEGAETHTLRLKSLYAAGATTLFELLDAFQLQHDALLRLAQARQTLRTERFKIEDRR